MRGNNHVQVSIRTLDDLKTFVIEKFAKCPFKFELEEGLIKI